MKKKPALENALSIFKLSLLYYAGWIIFAVKSSFMGVSSDWFMSSLGSHETYYGLEALDECFEMFIMYTVLVFWFIPLYQIIFLIIYAIRNKNKDKK